MRTCGPAQRAGRLREGEVFVSSVVSWGHPSKTVAERSRPSLLPTASPEVGRVVLEGEGADEARITVRRQKGASWRDDVCPVEAPLLSAASGLRDRSAPSLLGLWSLSERMSRAGGWAWADGGSVVRSPFLHNFSFGERFLTGARKSGKGEAVANLGDVENVESEASLRGRRDCTDGKTVRQTKNFAQSEVWHEAKSESSGILGEGRPSGSEASC